MVPTRIRFLTTALLSSWHWGPKRRIGMWQNLYSYYFDWLIDNCLYSAILHSWADSLRLHVILSKSMHNINANNSILLCVWRMSSMFCSLAMTPSKLCLSIFRSSLSAGVFASEPNFRGCTWYPKAPWKVVVWKWQQMNPWPRITHF